MAASSFLNAIVRILISNGSVFVGKVIEASEEYCVLGDVSKESVSGEFESIEHPVKFAYDLIKEMTPYTTQVVDVPVHSRPMNINLTIKDPGSAAASSIYAASTAAEAQEDMKTGDGSDGEELFSDLDLEAEREHHRNRLMQRAIMSGKPLEDATAKPVMYDSSKNFFDNLVPQRGHRRSNNAHATQDAHSGRGGAGNYGNYGGYTAGNKGSDNGAGPGRNYTDPGRVRNRRDQRFRDDGAPDWSNRDGDSQGRQRSRGFKQGQWSSSGQKTKRPERE